MSGYFCTHEHSKTDWTNVDSSSKPTSSCRKSNYFLLPLPGRQRRDLDTYIFLYIGYIFLYMGYIKIYKIICILTHPSSITASKGSVSFWLYVSNDGMGWDGQSPGRWQSLFLWLKWSLMWLFGWDTPNLTLVAWKSGWAPSLVCKGKQALPKDTDTNLMLIHYQ